MTSETPTHFYLFFLEEHDNYYYPSICYLHCLYYKTHQIYLESIDNDLITKDTIFNFVKIVENSCHKLFKYNDTACNIQFEIE